jgi:acyl-CoA synthetase (AMP-forming)/AMP-acid ligase II
MPDQIERVLRGLEAQLPSRVSLPGGDGYAATTVIWAKRVGPMPRAVVHCRTTEMERGTRGIILKEILASVKALLADYKVPERLEMVEAIPRNAWARSTANPCWQRSLNPRATMLAGSPASS